MSANDITAQQKKFYTESEYLAREREAETKSEYFQGEIFAMAGGSPTHSIIANNVGAVLALALKKKPCVAFQSDMRVKIAAIRKYCYPDVSVVCGKPEYEKDVFGESLLNPTLIVEVMSPSSADYDRGTKFAHYRALPSLKEYALVDSECVSVEVFTKQSNGKWLLSEYKSLSESALLESIDGALPLVELYEKTEIQS